MTINSLIYIYIFFSFLQETTIKHKRNNYTVYITYFCSTSIEYFDRLAQRLTHDTEGERSDKRLPTRNRRIKMVNTTYQWQLDRKKILAMDGTDTTARNTSASTLFRKLVDTCLWNKLRCRLKWEDKKRRGEGKKGHEFFRDL